MRKNPEKKLLIIELEDFSSKKFVNVENARILVSRSGLKLHSKIYAGTVAYSARECLHFTIDKRSFGL